MATLEKPTGINAGGRLSFNHLTAQAAYDSAHRAGSALPPKQRPQSVEDAKANFVLLLNGTGRDRIIKHVLEDVIPWFRQEVKDGNSKMFITDADIDTIEALIKDETWRDGRNGTTPFRDVDEKTAEMAPTAALAMTVKAYHPGTDIKQEAFVTDEEQLNTKPFSKKAVFPIDDTIFELYSGAYVKATVSFWIGEAGGMPYLSCSANSVVFWKEGSRFGGGSSDVEGMIEEDDDDLFDD